MSTSKEFTTQTDLQDLLEALSQQNLVYNGDFRYYSNRTSPGNRTEYHCPDGWLYRDPGPNGSIGFDEFTERCLIVKSQTEGTMRFSQALHEFPRWRQMLAGQWVTAKLVLDISGEANVKVTLYDGIDESTSCLTGPGDLEAEVRMFIHPEARCLILSVECDTPSAGIRISRVFANVGKVALKNLPCTVQGVIGQRKQYVATETPPAEELSLCASATELGPDHTRLDSVLNGRFGRGPKGYSLLPDMRGYFSRAWNNGADTDPDLYLRTALGGTLQGDHVGTVQPDEFREHSHRLSFSALQAIPTGRESTVSSIDTRSTSDTQRTGGNETRPKNIAELFTIKWS